MRKLQLVRQTGGCRAEGVIVNPRVRVSCHGHGQRARDPGHFMMVIIAMNVQWRVSAEQ